MKSIKVINTIVALALTNVVRAQNKCSSKITELGYPCCSNENCDIVYTDEDGTWGFENNKWCGIRKPQFDMPKQPEHKIGIPNFTIKKSPLPGVPNPNIKKTTTRKSILPGVPNPNSNTRKPILPGVPNPNANTRKPILPGVPNPNANTRKPILPGVPNPNTTKTKSLLPGVPNPNATKTKSLLPGVPNPNATKTKSLLPGVPKPTSIETILPEQPEQPEKPEKPQQQSQTYQCWAEYVGEHPCCSADNTLVYDHDANGYWGFDFAKNEWCGISPFIEEANVETCWSEALGYPCCKGCDVYETDEDGQWGYDFIENQWCGIQSYCPLI